MRSLKGVKSKSLEMFIFWKTDVYARGWKWIFILSDSNFYVL
jgi:hypothetical protein